MISLRKHRGVKNNRNSLLVTGTQSSDALIQFVFNANCFRSKDIGSLNTKDTFSIYNYLCSLLVYSIKHLKSDIPVIVLIDAAKIPIKALRLILKACQNVLAFRSKFVVIAQPDSFFEQQKLSLDILLESYDFKTTLCSKNKLWKYVNVADLADAFTPSFSNWNDIRKGFEEHFKQSPPRTEPSQIPTLNRLLQKGSSILIELSHPAEGKYSRVFEENDPIAKLVKEEEKDLSEPIYDEAMPVLPCKRNSNIEGLELPLEDSEAVLAAATLQHTKTFIGTDKIETDKTTTVSPPPMKEIPESLAKLLEEQKEAIHELLNWIHGAGIKWLNTLDEIGESADESRQLEKQHRSLSSRTEAVVDQAAEIVEVVEFLIREGNYPAICEPLKALSAELANAVYDFRQRVKQQSLIRANSLRLHESVAEFYNESDGLLKVLCNEIRPMEETNCQTELNELDKHITVVEDRFEVANEVCTVFENLLSEEKRKDDQKFIKEQLSLITERRKRCHELLDLQKLKLQQMIQLQTCETDQKQVIQWLEEITKQLKKDSFKYGLSQTAFNAKIIHFEKSAKSFFEYGKQLHQVSLLLRRSLRLEILPQLAISEKINSLSMEFEQNLNRYKLHAI